MIITKTITKKLLENIVHETFENFGTIYSSALLDSLKFLGFYYATNAGISINIEDLKTPNLKKNFLKNANQEMKYVSEQWQQGFVSDTERFQTIIDSWNFATESLKDQIIDYYQNFDPANNLYIMAFSGARGNMSQVRQLVGMRGLMSDQEGKIIDLPIQTNFREGLSSLDYIISSYGARKGIVDTALKTAESGYLTRRLIFNAQDLIIRQFDCKTKSGVLVLLKSNTNVQNIVGRYLTSAIPINNTSLISLQQNILLDINSLNDLKKNGPLSLKIRSPLTCQSPGSICQKCYGFDLAQNKLISLGEAVGIIAAQSIGEPGTQLTMRTFHTGGIFTSELLKQTRAPFSGKIIIPKSLKTVFYRTTHGIVAAKLQQETTISLINWKGIKKDIFLEIGSFLYILESGFIKKNQLISEYSDKSTTVGVRRLKPVYTNFSGEIRFESLLVRHITREGKPKVKVNQDDGVLWLASGKIFPFPKEVKYSYKEFLRTNKACAKLHLSSPYSGIVNFENEMLSLAKIDSKIFLNLNNFIKSFQSYGVHFSILCKNYQYIDQHTVLGIVNLFPYSNGKIYATRQKCSTYLNILFIVTDNDVWKINSDQVNNFETFPTKKIVVRAGTKLNSTSVFQRSGFFIRKEGFKMIFQNALPIFLSRGTHLYYNQGDFVFEKQILAMLANATQQTEDIVQGLPKIEELIEARPPKKNNEAKLSNRPGVFLNSLNNGNDRKLFSRKILSTKMEGDMIIYKYRKTVSVNNSVSKKQLQKQNIDITHSLTNENLVKYGQKLWNITLIPPEFKPEPTGDIYKFIAPGETASQDAMLFTNGKKTTSRWDKIKNISTLLTLVSNQNSFDNEDLKTIFKSKMENTQSLVFEKWISINLEEPGYKNKTGDLILKIQTQNSKIRFIYLKSVKTINTYTFEANAKPLFKEGQFIDLGEPITEGIINPHILLNIFFKYHEKLDGTTNGCIKSLNKFQLLVVNSIQAIYQSQGVNIASKHIEIIVRQMTTKVLILTSGDTPLVPGETVKLSLITEICNALSFDKKIIFNNQKTLKYKYKKPKYIPTFIPTTRSVLAKDGFLAAAGFQETKRVLTKAAIEGTTDWLRGLKECIIIGRLIPAGSAFLNYKHYLDNIYLYTDNTKELPSKVKN